MNFCELPQTVTLGYELESEVYIPICYFLDIFGPFCGTICMMHFQNLVPISFRIYNLFITFFDLASLVIQKEYTKLVQFKSKCFN